MTYLLREGGAKACRYETLLTRHDGRKILHDAIDANEWILVNLLLSPVNRSHLNRIEREAPSELLKAIGKGGTISTEDQVKEIFEHWLDLFTQETFSEAPIQIRIKDLEPGKYSLKQINSLCTVVNAAADYRALGALNTRPWAFNAVHHINNSRFSNRICKGMVSGELLSPFRLAQFTTDLEELKTEAFKRWETVLLAAQFPGSLETHNQILSLFRECDLSGLLRLAVLTSFLSPDRPIDETEHCRLNFSASSDIIPEILEAISNKDGTILKERFPIDPNVVIQCCSWAHELPPSYDEPRDT